MNSAQAPLVRTGNSCQRLVGVLRAPIQGDLNRERRPFGQVIRNLLSDDGSVCEKGDQESLPLRVGVDLQKVLAREDFATGVKQPEAAHLDQFIEDAEMFFLAQFALTGVEIAHGK